MRKQLEMLGLTPNETTVYMALIELEETVTGPLIKRSGLHRNLVYGALESLKDRQLVTEVVIGTKNLYRALTPEALVNNEKNRLSVAQDLAKNISHRIGKASNNVVMYQNPAGWQTAWKNALRDLKPKDTFYTIGMGGDKWVEAMGDSFLEYEQEAIKKKIKDKIIAHRSQKAEIENHQSNLIRDIRYLPDVNYPPANFEIFNNKVFIQIYEEPFTLIEISGPAVVKTYRHYFNILWKMAKK